MDKHKKSKTMKVLIVGGTGTLGKHIAERLKGKHELIITGCQSGDVQVDITDSQPIKQLFQKVGKINSASPALMEDSVEKMGSLFLGHTSVTFLQ
jgi:nucleoside-diphosphate-sugar epimerase